MTGAEEGPPGPRRLLLVGTGALLAGSSGLGLEVLVTELAGLTLGYGSAGPLALALFLAGWALGARAAGRTRRDPRRALAGVGLWLAALGALSPWLVVRAAGASPLLGSAVTLLVLLALALPQGAFLPLLVRGLGRGDLGGLFAANLVGAALGARLFGDALVAAGGRGAAAAGAGAAALLAGLVGRAALPARATVDGGERPAPAPGALTPRAAGLVLAGATAWVGALEWFGVRLGVLWLGGMQDALGAVLVASLLALSIGAAVLPARLPAGRAGVAALGALSALASLWLLFLPATLGRLGEAPLLLRALVLIGPAVAPLGAWPALLHRTLEGDPSRRLGALLGWEALGALVGLPLVHFVVLPALGMGGALVALAGVALLLLLARPPRAAGVVLAAALAALLLARPAPLATPVLDSPPLDDPALRVIALREDPHFAVSVVDDGLLGERTLFTDGFRAAASGRDYAYMRALAHLPLLLHGAPRSVGVLAFGTGTTAGAVSLHERVESLEVLELSRAVTELAPHFAEANHDVLADPRVRVTHGDGRRTLASRPGAYDVLTMEPLLPDSPFGVYLYTEEFYARARAALRPGGLLCQWVPPHALEPATFEAVLAAFGAAFEWPSVWVFGTQVILVGGAGAPDLDAGRFPAADGALARDLAGLGLDSVGGVTARLVVAGEVLPEPSRRLSDLDPWIVYTPRRRGALLLSDLPRNLATLRALAGPLPEAWRAAGGAEPERRREAVALVREAREAMEAARARAALAPAARGESEFTGAEAAREALAGLAACSERDPLVLLERARERAPSEPALLRLEARLEFEAALREGYALLASGGDERALGEAAARLVRAVQLRPERADAHAYLGAALRRLGSDRAQGELARALELCPRLAETPVGARLARLGVPVGPVGP